MSFGVFASWDRCDKFPPMQKSSLIPIFVILSLGISACTKKEDSKEPAPILLPKPGEPAPKLSSCEEFMKALPTDYIKGFVEVPEDYAKPDGIKIKVAYYGKLIAGQTPTVFYNGGPGGSSWSSYGALSRTKFKDWRDTSFIYVDQRGNGCSEAYPEFTGVATDEMIARYKNYGSTNIVKDSEVIRKKVWGHKPWKIFGQSYGAYVVHRYIVEAPEGVLSAHAHANTINSDPLFRHANRIGSQGRVIGEFLKRFPEDESALRILGKSLTNKACVYSDDGKQKACGFQITEALVYSLGFTNSDNWISIHQWVNYLIRDGNLDIKRLKEFADALVFREGGGTPGRNMAMTVLAIVDRGIMSRDFAPNYEGCKAVFEELKKRGHANPEEWPINECASTYQAGKSAPGDDPASYQALVDRILKVMKLDVLKLDDFERALNEYPYIPFYLYSGEYDTFVPRESFGEELERLGSRIQYAHFSGTGHEGFYLEPLVWKNLKALP